MKFSVKLPGPKIFIFERKFMNKTKEQIRKEHIDLAFQNIDRAKNHVRDKFPCACRCATSDILERFTDEELETIKKFLLVEIASNAIIIGSVAPQLAKALTIGQGINASSVSHILDTLERRKADIWADEIIETKCEK